ncbi:MAG: hypothetical protein DWQ35_00455 [Planctomycetota bacterium]|nr:MAG: hypothetical protein DWQ35_00455 [Planctomycetota bacterium]
MRRKAAAATDEPKQLVHLSLDVLVEGDNARKVYRKIPELAAAIATEGLIHPLWVRDQNDGTYRIVSGFRRRRALLLVRHKPALDDEGDEAKLSRLVDLRLLGPHRFESVPCLLFEGDELDEALANLGENLGRDDLSVWELACRFAQLRERFGLVGQEIADRQGLSKSYVNKVLRVHDNAGPELRRALESGAEYRSESIFTARRILSCAALPHDAQKKELDRWHGRTGILTRDPSAPKTPKTGRMVSYGKAATMLLELEAKGMAEAATTLRWAMRLGESPLSKSEPNEPTEST